MINGKFGFPDEKICLTEGKIARTGKEMPFITGMYCLTCDEYARKDNEVALMGERYDKMDSEIALMDEKFVWMNGKIA